MQLPHAEHAARTFERVGSRLALDSAGRLIVVVTTGSASTPAGTVFRALGNALECAGSGVGFLGAQGEDRRA